MIQVCPTQVTPSVLTCGDTNESVLPAVKTGSPPLVDRADLFAGNPTF